MDMHTPPVNLGIYPPAALRVPPITDHNHQNIKPAQAKGVEIALAEPLRVVSNEIWQFSHKDFDSISHLTRTMTIDCS